MIRVLRLLFVLTLSITVGTVNAQMVIDNTLTPTQLVQDVLLGQGVVVSNITYTGTNAQRGYFNGSNSNIGINEGIILASGDVVDAVGPNNSGSAGSGQGGSGDIDLEELSGDATFDAVILEFDFVPTGDSIRFNYVFGSEEYNEYVCGTVNDVFGFFLSGPGINGPFSGNAVNLALIPGTNTPVSINTVNLGVSGINGTPANCASLDPNWANYNIYFFDNPNGATVQYDGFTVPLTARSQVQCGETYHIKMALADGGDGVFDSGVFIEARSFVSNAIQVEITTLSGDSAIVEGCTSAVIDFQRPEADSLLAVPIYVSGNAIDGVDFTGLPDTIYFNPGDSIVTVTVTALEDGLFESVRDTLIITVYSLNLCGDTMVSTGVIYIQEDYNLSIVAPDVSVLCPQDSVLLVATAGGGNPDYTYTWSTGAVGDSIWVPANTSGTFTVMAEDLCAAVSPSIPVDVNVNTQPTPSVTISGPQSFNCVPAQVLLSASGSLGSPPYTYQWSNGAVSSSISVSLTSDTVFSVVLTDACGVESAPDIHFIIQNPVATPTLQTSNDAVLDCPGETATLTAIASGGTPPYNYVWSNSAVTSTISVQPTQTTEYIITVTDACFVGSVQDTITVTVIPYTQLGVVATDTAVTCPSDDAILFANGNGGLQPYSFTWSNAVNGNTNEVNPASTESFVVTLTDACGNSTTDTSTVDVPVYDELLVNLFNIDLEMGDTIVICELWGDTVSSTVTGGLAPYLYTWSGTLIDGTEANNDSALMTVPYELSPDSNVAEIYSLNVVDQCGTEVLTEFVVNVISCDIVQPNVFNPNSAFNGGTDFCGSVPQNNVFNLPCLELYPGNEVTIWDRWGRKCYQTEDYHLHPWDGGKQATGVYYYVCEFPNGKEPVKGFFHLLK